MDRQTGPRLFILLLLCSLCMLLLIFSTYLSAIILGMLIASVSYPLHQFLKKTLRNKSRIAAALMTFFILFILVIPVGWFVDTLSREAFDFYNRTKTAVSKMEIQQFIESDNPWAARLRKAVNSMGFQINHEMLNQVATFLGKDVGLFVYKQLSSVASNLVSFLVHFFLMMTTIYFLFRDGEKLQGYIIQLLPMPGPQVEKVAGKFHEMARAIIIGNGLSGIIQGIMGGLGFFLFGMPSPFLWGTVIAVTAFLPIIGAGIVFIPAGLILLIQGNTGIALGYLIYNIIYSAATEYLFKPRFIGKGMSMNPLLVFLGILGGMKLFGVIGIIYGPLIITVFLTMAEIYRLEYRPKEELSEVISRPI